MVYDGDPMVKTLKEGKTRYKEAMKVKYKNYLPGIAAFLGVSTERIKDAGPVKSYEDKFDTPEDRDARADAWETGIKAAFGIT